MLSSVKYHIKKILESYNYLLNIPGKNIRSIMINIFQKWLQIPEDKLLVIREIVNSLHTSSLMYSHYRNAFMYRIDDIEDNSKQRRGVPGGILLYR